MLSTRHRPLAPPIVKPAFPTRAFLLLGALYLVQGMPYGFQSQGLRIALTERGVSLTHVGLAGALALPWSLKIFLAPLVDRYGSGRFGRRKSWIVPMQVLLALACGAAALVPEQGDLLPLLLAVLVMNACAATMDIAVDGMAVDVLRGSEQLGAGNGVQVVGYKLGMLLGGGVLVIVAGSLGWPGLFGAMGLIVLAVIALTLATPEAPSETAREHVSMRDVLRSLVRVMRGREALGVLLVVATYKAGEAMADSMWSPMLVLRGWSREEIGLVAGTWGMGASIAGSLAGAAIAMRLPPARALLVTALLRVAPIAMQLVVVMGQGRPSLEIVSGVTIAESFFGGALTTAMFAFMMGRVDREIGATHFTLLATVEVLGKTPSGLLGGLVSDALGLPAAFGIAALLSALYVPLLWLPGVRDASNDDASRTTLARGESG